MSNDRFKQARRSLMNQQQAQPRPQRPVTPDFDDDAEEATALVDINELRAGAAAAAAAPSSSPQPPMGGRRLPPQQPSGRHASPARPGSHQVRPGPSSYHQEVQAPSYFEETFEDDPHEATQMVDLNAFNAPPLQAAPQAPPVQRSVRIGGEPPAQPSGHYPADNPSNVPTQYTNMNGMQGAFGSQPAPGARDYRTDAMPAIPASNPQAPPSLPGRYDGTQTLDLDDLQEVDDYGAPSEQGFAEESTQFVDLNALAAGAPSVTTPATFGSQPVGSVTSPQQDPLLSQSYQFTPEAIQQYGSHTLIFARNQQGQDIVLKRIWEGHSSQMPEEMRQKLNLLMQIQHPHLIRMCGVFDSHSGCWVELERPPGNRLSHMLQNGSQSRLEVALWAYPVADAIQHIHTYSILYANLTPDAVWIDLTTKTIVIEPFDILSFEDRGGLGVYGPPELQQPGAYPPTPATDVYSFAAVVVAALTATPDPNQVGLVEHNKLKQELIKALELNPGLRPTEFSGILGAIGERVDLNPESKKSFDKRLIPVIVLIVVLMGVILWPSGSSKKAVQYRQDLPDLPAEDRQALGSPPGEVSQDENVIVLNSYMYNPPQKVDPIAKADVDTSGHIVKIREILKNVATFKHPEKDLKEALKLLGELKAAAPHGELSGEELEVYNEAMKNPKMRAYRKELVENVEKPLFSDPDISNSRLGYKPLSIDPDATSSEFFNNYKTAKIVKLKAGPPPASKPKSDEKAPEKEEK